MDRENVEISKGERGPGGQAKPWEYLNPQTEIDIRTGGRLPHWEQGSVWYFVTYRLADALPKSVADTLRLDREEWRRRHDPDNLTKAERAEYQRLFSERYDALLDSGNGCCLLRDAQNAKIVEDSFRCFDGERYVLDAWIVMPNHVHILVKPLAEFRLFDILHSWKSFTANAINKRAGRRGQLWQHESYDHIVRGSDAIEAIRRYIRENPKVAGSL